MENINPPLDEGFLAQVLDGCVSSVAASMQITPQRLHQIIGNDPFAQYMRIHRHLAPTCPARAQQMADRFNQTHEVLVRRARQLIIVTPAEALSLAESEGLDVLKAELGKLPVAKRKRETLQYIKALWAYFGALEVEEALEGATSGEGGEGRR